MRPLSGNSLYWHSCDSLVNIRWPRHHEANGCRCYALGGAPGFALGQCGLWHPSKNTGRLEPRMGGSYFVLSRIYDPSNKFGADPPRRLGRLHRNCNLRGVRCGLLGSVVEPTKRLLSRKSSELLSNAVTVRVPIHDFLSGATSRNLVRTSRVTEWTSMAQLRGSFLKNNNKMY
jgi:hypothetical protein